MGDLAYWMDENFLYSLFVPTGALQNVKIIRNKASNASEGYGFVEFATHAAAEDVLQTLNGTPIPNTDQIFRLNWAAFGVGKQTQEGTDNSKPADTSCCFVLVCCYLPTQEADCAWAAVHVDHSIFVGDLAPEVTDYMLQEHFRQYYPSVRSAKVTSPPAADITWNIAYCSLDTSLPLVISYAILCQPLSNAFVLVCTALLLLLLLFTMACCTERLDLHLLWLPNQLHSPASAVFDCIHDRNMSCAGDCRLSQQQVQRLRLCTVWQ